MGSDAPSNGRYSEVLNSTVVVTLARLVFPALLTVVIGMAGTILWDLRGQVEEAKDSTKLIWQEIGSIQKASTAAAIAAQMVSGDLATTDKAVADHEQRIRILEHTPH